MLPRICNHRKQPLCVLCISFVGYVSPMTDNLFMSGGSKKKKNIFAQAKINILTKVQESEVLYKIVRLGYTLLGKFRLEATEMWTRQKMTWAICTLAI